MRRTTKIKACPNCGSPEIEYASLDRRSGGFTGLGIPAQYYCKRCGYKGGIILEATRTAYAKMRFPNKKQASYRPQTASREPREIAGPIVLAVLALFLVASILIILPKREISTVSYSIPADNSAIKVQVGDVEYDVVYGLKRTITGTIPTGEQVTIISEPKQGETQLTVITMNETSAIQRATGIGNVSGYLVYVFLLFLFFGFATMGAWSWWRKTPLFG